MGSSHFAKPQIRHYGCKLGRPFRQPLRHIITHHKNWIFWIINDHILVIHNILTISLVTISISTIILIISCIFICLFTTQICWAQAYQCWVIRWKASHLKTSHLITPHLLCRFITPHLLCRFYFIHQVDVVVNKWSCLVLQICMCASNKVYKLLNKRNPYLTSVAYYLDFRKCNPHYLVPICSANNLESNDGNHKRFAKLSTLPQ